MILLNFTNTCNYFEAIQRTNDISQDLCELSKAQNQSVVGAMNCIHLKTVAIDYS